MLLAAGNATKATQLETRKALLLIDLQNDFLDPAGKLHIQNTKLLADKIPILVKTFRQYGIVVWSQTQYIAPVQTISPESGSPVIVLEDLIVTKDVHSQVHQADPAILSFDSQNDPNTNDSEAFLASRPAGSDTCRCCLPATVGQKMPQSLTSGIDHDRDIVQSKSHYSAFHDGGLLFNLRRNVVTDLYLCGSLSNIGVYATALDAVSHGFNITVVEDCVGYRSDRCHAEAMRQMADGMGANGIDHQELIDELNGDLGDIVTDETFPNRYKISRSENRRGPDRSLLKPTVEAWMSNIDETSPYGHEIHEPESTESDASRRGPPRCNEQGATSSAPPTSSHESDQHLLESIMAQHFRPTDGASKPSAELTRSGTLRTPTPDDTSPPRKRFTGDMDDNEADFKSKQSAKYRRPSDDPPVQPRLRTNRTRVRRRPPSAAPPSAEDSRPTSGDSDLADLQQPAQATNVTSTPRLPTVSLCHTPEDRGLQTLEEPTIAPIPSPPKPPLQPSNPAPDPLLAAASPPTTRIIGEGDSRLILSLLPTPTASTIFSTLKSSTQWSTMSHRGGPVPRLVAVQGEISNSSSTTTTADASSAAVPIYRHPADVSPPLHPFPPTVRLIQRAAEELVAHPLNHVLLQLYRSGEDNISEHSDKTLDIARGSEIVNVSFGAERVMTLRRKRAALQQSAASPETAGGIEASAPPQRESQKIRLPHNSAFVLGPLTNQHWLHGIRPDKRAPEQKTWEERAFGGERISLTFRHVATFVDAEKGLIWGQGATGKRREGARGILKKGEEAEAEGREMLGAMGRENRESGEWDWEEGYGRGFDVVDFGGHEHGGGEDDDVRDEGGEALEAKDRSDDMG